MLNLDISYHSTSCENCGEIVSWKDSDYVGGNKEDDKFSCLMDKLNYHKKNDPKCNREKKLKQLFND